LFENRTGPGLGLIDRITVDSYLEIPAAYISPPVRPILGIARRIFPFIGGEGGSVRIGPFPKGMPIALITNIDVLGEDLPPDQYEAHRQKLIRLGRRAIRELKGNPDFGTALSALAEDMFDVSKCKDLVVNKGHYFGTSYFTEEPGLNDADKQALIAFLKTF
jgi:hypothetical protein